MNTLCETHEYDEEAYESCPACEAQALIELYDRVNNLEDTVDSLLNTIAKLNQTGN